MDNQNTTDQAKEASAQATGTAQIIQLTFNQLRAICSNAKDEWLKEALPHLNNAFIDASINTKQRCACILGQVLLECGEFKYREEVASGAAYEGRKDLGNTMKGDGIKYKGHGWIQITGRKNHALASEAIGVDFVNNPQLATLPVNCAKILAWYWNTNQLNLLADKGDERTITKRVNGACTDGKPSFYLRRHAYHDKVLKVLG
jgi:predicted chitinase